jgi:hypothetical protein
MSNIDCKKILYVGTGTHIESITYFPICNEFIFIDTLPRSEWDGIIDKNAYNKTFVKIVLEKCNNHGFSLNKITNLDQHYTPYNIDYPYTLELSFFIIIKY